MLLVRHGILETDLLSAASDVLFTLRLSVGTTHPLLGAISGINRILHHSDLVPDGQLRLDLVASLRGGEFPAPEPSLSDLASSCEAVA